LAKGIKNEQAMQEGNTFILSVKGINRKEAQATFSAKRADLPVRVLTGSPLGGDFPGVPSIQFSAPSRITGCQIHL
jgi:hypothetical protein